MSTHGRITHQISGYSLFNIIPGTAGIPERVYIRGYSIYSSRYSGIYQQVQRDTSAVTLVIQMGTAGIPVGTVAILASTVGISAGTATVQASVADISVSTVGIYQQVLRIYRFSGVYQRVQR